MDLQKKVALITGGANGIGAATAMEFARRGADIAILDLEEKEVAYTIRNTIENLGRRCLLVKSDLGDAGSIARSVGIVMDEMGGIDAMVHCAGIRVVGGLMNVSQEAWQQAFDLHVHAIFHLCRVLYPFMTARGEGAIVLISSAAGLRGCLGAIGYDVVKGAIPQFTRDLAREFAEYNIRVNCVAPGIIRTRFQEYLTIDQVENNIKNRIPLHREGKAEDVAHAIAFLVENDFITGECLVIDGGMSMRIV